jgi:hypothetical protein
MWLTTVQESGAMPITKDLHWLDRRVSNAELIAGSRAAIAQGRRWVEIGDRPN